MRILLVLAALGAAAALGSAAIGGFPFDAVPDVASDAAGGAARGHLPAWALFTFAVSAFRERLS